MNKITQIVALVAVMAIGAVGWHFASTPDAVADDASRITSLTIKMHDFDGTGAVSAVVAEAGSVDGNDLHAELKLFWTVPGGQEEEGASAHTDRLAGDPNLYLSYALPVTEFPSGTALRAVFLIKDNTGNPTLTMTRTSSVP